MLAVINYPTTMTIFKSLMVVLKPVLGKLKYEDLSADFKLRLGTHTVRFSRA